MTKYYIIFIYNDKGGILHYLEQKVEGKKALLRVDWERRWFFFFFFFFFLEGSNDRKRPKFSLPSLFPPPVPLLISFPFLREDHMVHHSTQHLLSALARSFWGWKTTGPTPTPTTTTNNSINNTLQQVGSFVHPNAMWNSSPQGERGREKERGRKRLRKGDLLPKKIN